MTISMRRLTSHNYILLFTFLIAIAVCYYIVPGENKSTFLLYASTIVLSLFFAAFSDVLISDKLTKISFWIGIFILGALMAFRSKNAIDDLSYQHMFLNAATNNISQYINATDTENGYDLVNWILYHLTNGNYDVSQVILMYFSFLMWGLAISHMKDYVSFPVAVLCVWTHYYFFVMDAGLLRIFIAISIVLYALHYLWESNWKLFVLWIAIAASFHLSALIMLIFLFLFINEKWFYKNWGFVIPILIIAILVVFLLIAKIAPLLGERYIGYIGNGAFSISLGSFDTLPIFVVGVYYYKFVPNEWRKPYIIGLLLLTLSILFSVFSSIINLGRLIYYANFGVLIVVATICKIKPRDFINQGISVLMIVYLVFYMMHTTLLNEGFERLYPYQFFWNE